MTFAQRAVRTVGRPLAAVFISAVFLQAQDLPVQQDASRYEILLTKKMFDRIDTAGTFTYSLDITPNRLLLLSTADQFYVLGWGGIVPYGKKTAGDITSFAYTSDSLLMTVRNSELCVFDSLGNLARLIPLPARGMGICAGKDVMYVFERGNAYKKHAVYVLVKGGKYAKVFESPAPVTAMMEVNGQLLFAIGNGLYSFDPGNRELRALAAVQKGKTILSIAFDSRHQRVCFSTDSSVCALKDSHVVVITGQFGGVLRYLNDGLVVFNPAKKSLIRMIGIECAMASAAATVPQPLYASTSQYASAFSGKWEHLYAARWLCGKAVSAAGKGDLTEAVFLCDQAFAAAAGGRLKVQVPPAPAQPASTGSPENEKLLREFIGVIFRQAQAVIDAGRNLKAAEKEAGAAKQSAARQQGPDEADKLLADAQLEFQKQKMISEELDRMADQAGNDPGFLSRLQSAK